jgi:hypothetical protein
VTDLDTPDGKHRQDVREGRKLVISERDREREREKRTESVLDQLGGEQTTQGAQRKMKELVSLQTLSPFSSPQNEPVSQSYVQKRGLLSVISCRWEAKCALLA